MNVSNEPAARRRRELRWVATLFLVLASGCGGGSGGGGGGSPASPGNWDELVWDQSNWT